jgi:hypothetical protein
VEFMLLCIDPERVRALGEALAPGRPWHARTVTDLRDVGIAALSKEIRRATVADQPAHPPYLQSLADAMMVRLLRHFLGEVDTTVGREAPSPGMLDPLAFFPRFPPDDRRAAAALYHQASNLPRARPADNWK